VNEILKAVKDAIIGDVMSHLQGEMPDKITDLEESHFELTKIV